MNFHIAAASLAAIGLALASPASAQVKGPVTAPISRPSTAPAPQITPIGPPAPESASPVIARSGPLPSVLTLEQALDEAVARSPSIVAAEADVEAARGRLRQAGVRPNPELNVEVENFAGTGAYTGINATETTVSINQRLDLGGRRSARVSTAQAALKLQEIKLAIAKAELAQGVRGQFATAVAARDRLAIASANRDRARELARVANELVEAGREPPLRSLRARAALAQAEAALNVAQADELAARRSLAVLFGLDIPPERVEGDDLSRGVGPVDPAHALDVRLADAERLSAEAQLRQEQASARLDPSVGVGIRQIRETNDHAFVAGVSLPLPIFDRNRGNIAAARSNVTAAFARRSAALASATAQIRNAATAYEAAEARVQALEAAAIPQAKEGLRLTDLAYRAGRASLLELLDAQQAFAEIQNQLIEARLQRAQAAATLVRAAAR
jgi:cobalt-zinc-cadmium efflux system outer membrane protein